MSTATTMAQQLPNGAGFSDPVGDSQKAFRQVLEALSRPGGLHIMESKADARSCLHAATAAICLALADFETRIWLDPMADDDETGRYLRFHCGTTLVDDPAAADFVVIAGPPPSLDKFNTGTDAYPEEGATLIIQTDGIADDGPLLLSGPGIDGSRRLSITGISDDFWSQRAALLKGFPRGLDLIFTSGAQIAAIPRTTKVTAEPVGA